MEKQPRIAMLLSSLEVGGTQRVMLNLMEGFVKKGITVDAVVVKAKGLFLEKLPDKVNLIDLSAKRALSSIPALIKYMRRYNPDAVFSGLTHINSVAIISRFLSNTAPRLVVSERSNLSQKRRHAVRFWDKHANIFINILYPLADVVVTVSQDAARDIIKTTKLDPKKVVMIYNPIPVDTIRKLSLKKISPRLDTISTPLILAVGRLSPAKDYPTLIQAFNILRERVEAHLVIIGEGEERSSIEKLIVSSPYSEDIRLLGEIENPYPYMAISNVFVLSSAWEGFVNVLVEALACGATVVASDCPSSPKEILENGKFGHLVPVGDAQAFADAIEYSLNNPFPSEQSIARARVFSEEEAVNKYLKVLLPNYFVFGEEHK